jgi:hypothetical protein
MGTMTNSRRDHIGRLLACLPVLSLTLAALAWLRYGIDMPWFDDWRGYAAGNIDSLDLHDLFQPMNDTMSPVGLALDALAQRFLDGNSVAYQFVSMVTVLGSLLVLQWKLLKRVMDTRWQVAVCFLFTLLMLQPDSYWGLENLAYYQALPLVFILWALVLMSGAAVGSALRGPAVGMLGLLAGFSYISGAFGAFAVGVASLMLARRLHAGTARQRLMRDWTWFTAASGVTAAVQFYFSVLKLRGTHYGLPPMARPIEPEFWAFYLGKLGRSLLLPPDWPWTSVFVTVLACAIALATAIWLARRALSQAGTAQERQAASIYLPLGALVLVYLMLVAAGRTNFRPAEMHGLLQIFAHGFTRFHFFWATLIWPWVVAALLVLCSRNPWFRRVGPAWALTIAMVFTALVYLGSGFGHMSKLRKIGVARTNLAHCLLEELQRGGEVRCPGLLPPRFETDPVPDAVPAYLYAKKIGASFVRNFPMLPHGTRRATIAPFYKIEAGSPKPRTYEMESLGNGAFRSVGNDPQLYIQTGLPQITRNCMIMDVDVVIKVSERDLLQLFYVPAGGDEEYSAQHVVDRTVGTDDGSLQTFHFRLESATGFFESLRLDPATRPQSLMIPSIKVYCVRELP